ncbi:MAG: leucine-rich repeat domain-containing protein [Bacteroidales bacterium]|nr:leucine-rich repeat domain-containing protein [Bacteroidales bacterium]
MKFCVLAILAAATLSTSAATTSYSWQGEAVEVDGLLYHLSANGSNVAQLCGYADACPTDLVVPDAISYDGTTYAVTHIGTAPFFPYDDYLGATYDPTDFPAFFNESALRTVTLGQNIIDIDPGNFAGCANLTSITTYKTPTTASEDDVVAADGWLAIYGSTLTTLIAPYGHTYSGTFSLATSLLSSAPEAYRDRLMLGEYALYGQSQVTAFNIGTKCTVSSGLALAGMENLATITTDNGTYKASSGTLYSSDYKRLIFVCPNAVTSGTFTPSATLTSIDTGAFFGCSSLKKILLNTSTPGKNIATINRLAFYRSGLTEFTCDRPDISISNGACANCKTLKTVELYLSELPNYMFYGCSALTSLSLPQTTIYSVAAFYGCNSLKAINFHKNTTDIKGWCFTGCTSLETIATGGVDHWLPAGLKRIDSYAFTRTKLTKLYIPANTTDDGLKLTTCFENMKSQGITFWINNKHWNGSTWENAFGEGNDYRFVFSDAAPTSGPKAYGSLYAPSTALSFYKDNAKSYNRGQNPLSLMAWDFDTELFTLSIYTYNNSIFGVNSWYEGNLLDENGTLVYSTPISYGTIIEAPCPLVGKNWEVNYTLGEDAFPATTTYVITGSSSAIHSTENDLSSDSAPRYFDLQGRPLSTPAGLCIEVTNGHARKILK